MKVFRCFLKTAMDFEPLIFDGRAFHRTGPATEKAPAPTHVLVSGLNNRVLSIADLVTGPELIVSLCLTMSAR